MNVDGKCWQVEEVRPLPMGQKVMNRFFNHRHREVNRPRLVIVQQEG